MLESEKLRVMLFAAALASVYSIALVDVASLALRRLERVNAPESAFTRRRRFAVFAVAILGFGCMAYGRFVEPYWPRVTHVELESARLVGATRPIRIVHISDLHSEVPLRLEHRLTTIIVELKPDVVVFTGDAVNSADGLPAFRSLMGRLTEEAPVFAVLGNWDVGNPELYAGTDVRVLDSESATLDIAGATVRIAGVSVGGAGDAHGLVADTVAHGDFTVFLYHKPDLVEDLQSPGPDLYLAGHTHGGQVALPLYGALMTLSKFGKRYEAGLYSVGATNLYVNSGIGMVGGSAPRVRFWARPEVTLITIAVGAG